MHGAAHAGSWWDIMRYERVRNITISEMTNISNVKSEDGVTESSRTATARYGTCEMRCEREKKSNPKSNETTRRIYALCEWGGSSSVTDRPARFIFVRHITTGRARVNLVLQDMVLGGVKQVGGALKCKHFVGTKSVEWHPE